jgi:hypothetical protein
MKLLLTFILVIITSFANACILRGHIYDSSDNKELAYINLSIEKNTKLISQTISNEDGYFEIYVNETDLPINLKISATGYVTKSIMINNCSELIISLDKSNLNLPEVSVINYSAKSILYKCLENLQKNLYTKPFNTETFYRKIQTDNNGKFIYSSEYHSKIYFAYDNAPGIININSRYKDNENNKYLQKAIKEGNWEIRSLLSYELYSISSYKKPSIGFLNIKNIEKCKIELQQDDYIIDSLRYYIINVHSEQNDYLNRSMKLYINAEDFSIFKYQICTYRNKKLVIDKEYRYSKINNKYFLNTILEKSINIDNTIDNSIMYNSKFEFEKVQKLSNNTNSILNSSLKNVKVFNNDSLYWVDKVYLPYKKGVIK